MSLKQIFVDFMPGFLYAQFFITPTLPKNADCTDKTVIITGANSGLGKEAVRHFVKLNANRVILTCRNASKGQAAKDDIETSTGRKGVVDVWELDYCDYDSVKSFVERCKTELDRVDILIENAGISSRKFEKVAGHEATITVNVVSTFLLACLMMPVLQQTAKRWSIVPNLTIVASDVHFVAKFEEKRHDPIFAALSDEKIANMDDRYNVSKLMELLLIREITTKHPVAETNVTINTLTPGFCHSELLRELDSVAVRIVKKIIARTTEVGSRTLVIAGISGTEAHGAYMADGKMAHVAPFVTSQEAHIVQKKLWSELKEELEKIQPGVTGVLA